MKLKFKYDDLIFVMLFINGIALTAESIYGINTYVRPFFLGLSVILIIRAFYFRVKVTQLKTLVGLSFLGNEVLLMLIPILILPSFLTVFDRLKVRRPAMIALLFVVYSVVMLVASNVREFSFLTIGFWFITFGSFFVLFLYYSRLSFTQSEIEEIFGFFKKVILLQIPIMFVQAVIHRDFTPGDFWTGSAGNAIVPGFYFCIYLIYIFARYFIHLNRKVNFLAVFKNNLVVLFFFAVLMYFNDSKMIIIVFAIGAMLYLLWVLVLRFLTRLRLILLFKTILTFAFLLFMVVGTYFVSIWYVNRALGTHRGLDTYSDYTQDDFDDSGANAKYILYRRVYLERFYDNPSSWWFGAGPGKFASKTSNILAYDVLYKTERQTKLPLFVKPYSSFEVKKYMADLWTEKIARSMRWRSSMLSMPFSGMITIKGEYGFVGLVIFLFMIYGFSFYLLKKAFKIENWRLKDWAIVLSMTWFTLPLHMLFENYQDRAYMMIPLFTLTAALYAMTPRKDLNPAQVQA